MDRGTTVHRAGGAYVVQLAGAVDASGVPDFNRTMARLIDDERAGVVVDLVETSLLDSRMIGALAGWYTHADHFGRGRVAFAVGNGSSTAAGVFRKLMQGRVPLYATVDEALAAFDDARAHRHGSGSP